MTTHTLHYFLNEWLNHEEWWFCPTHKYDEIIKDRFSNILECDYFVGKNLSEIEICALCIAYDQIPRHIYRNNKQQVEYFLQKSLYILRNIPDIMVYDGYLLCFLLLPLRHTRILSNLKEATDIIWQKLEADPLNSKKYKRFLKASYQTSYQELMYFDEGSDYNIETFRDILDFKGTFRDELTIPDTYIIEEFKKHIKDDKQYIVSISGGVDSMIVSYLAKQLLTNVVCLHINYTNRSTSLLESKFVEYWCSIIGLPLYTRHITEINRPLCMKFDLRETYETYTKKVRYACYKEVSKVHWGSEQVNVLLGHNKDDCFENILTNIRNCTKYENLLGMDYESSIDDITFYRPFLDFPKSKIIESAQSQGISYLYDSTPKWSQRGKIRDNVVPTLNEWDPNCINSMFMLATRMSELITIRDKYIKQIMNTMTKKEDSSVCVYEFSCDADTIDTSTLSAIFKELKVLHPSQKALTSMVSCYYRLKYSKSLICYNLSKCLKIKIDTSFKHNLAISYYKNV